MQEALHELTEYDDQHQASYTSRHIPFRFLDTDAAGVLGSRFVGFEALPFATETRLAADAPAEISGVLVPGRCAGVLGSLSAILGVIFCPLMTTDDSLFLLRVGDFGEREAFLDSKTNERRCTVPGVTLRVATFRGEIVLLRIDFFGVAALLEVGVLCVTFWIDVFFGVITFLGEGAIELPTFL